MFGKPRSQALQSLHAGPTRLASTALALSLTLVIAAARADATEPAPTQASDSSPQELHLTIGQQRVLSARGVRSYSEAVRGVVDVRLTKDASEFVLVALKPGSTTLLLLMQDGSERHFDITVTDPNARSLPPGSTEVLLRENIRLDFYFVQLDRSFGYQIGIGWPESVASPTLNASFDFISGAFQSATAVVANQALPRLDMAQHKGWAKLMRQASVVAANGEKATFSGGQEVNILVQTSIATGVQRIEAGSTIEVQPRYDAETGRLEVHLHADISELQTDRGTGVPGRSTSTLDTVVNIELGQAIVLGGLSARSKRSDKNGLPGLSGIPIFGALFGSHASVEEEMENIAIIVPSVVDALAARDRERIDHALARYLDYSGGRESAKLFPARTPETRRPE